MKASKQQIDEALANNMNCFESHLGGYIMSSREPAPSGLNIENGDPATWTPELWLWIHQKFEVRSMVDVGCGEGHCAGFFAKHGCEVVGIDGSRRAAHDSVIPDAHVIHDFVTAPYVPIKSYDLVWSCEFVEHVEAQYADNFLAVFSKAAKCVAITYASPGQPGWHHVNCQPEEYWIEKLSKIGFVLDEALTQEARGFARGHFKHKGLLFRPAKDTGL